MTEREGYIYIYTYIKRAAVAVTKHQNGGDVTCDL